MEEQIYNTYMHFYIITNLFKEIFIRILIYITYVLMYYNLLIETENYCNDILYAIVYIGVCR